MAKQRFSADIVRLDVPGQVVVHPTALLPHHEGCSIVGTSQAGAVFIIDRGGALHLAGVSVPAACTLATSADGAFVAVVSGRWLQLWKSSTLRACIGLDRPRDPSSVSGFVRYHNALLWVVECGVGGVELRALDPENGDVVRRRGVAGPGCDDVSVRWCLHPSSRQLAVSISEVSLVRWATVLHWVGENGEISDGVLPGASLCGFSSTGALGVGEGPRGGLALWRAPFERPAEVLGDEELLGKESHDSLWLAPGHPFFVVGDLVVATTAEYRVIVVDTEARELVGEFRLADTVLTFVEHYESTAAPEELLWAEPVSLTEFIVGARRGRMWWWVVVSSAIARQGPP